MKRTKAEWRQEQVKEGIIPNPKARLLDQVREVIRLKHYSLRTEQTYIAWMKRFIFFHQKRHPREMGGREIQAFLSHLAVQKHVTACTQNQALNALVFLYHEVLHLELGDFSEFARAKRPVHGSGVAKACFPLQMEMQKIISI